MIIGIPDLAAVKEHLVMHLVDVANHLRVPKLIPFMRIWAVPWIPCLLDESLLLPLDRFNFQILPLLFIVESPHMFVVTIVTEVVLLRWTPLGWLASILKGMVLLIVLRWLTSLVVLISIAPIARKCHLIREISFHFSVWIVIESALCRHFTFRSFGMAKNVS